MKKTVFCALLALALFAAFALADEGSDMAPDFTVYDREGAPVSLSGMLGRPVIVNIWATWCPPCRAELGYFDEAAQEYGDEIAFMMVDMTDGQYETVQGVEEFLAQTGYAFPVYFDTDYSAADAYRVEAIPTSLFITADGKLMDLVVGSMEREFLRQHIDALLSASRDAAAQPAPSAA